MSTHSSVAEISSSYRRGRESRWNSLIDAGVSLPNLISLSMLANVGSFCRKTCVRRMVCSIVLFQVAASKANRSAILDSFEVHPVRSKSDFSVGQLGQHIEPLTQEAEVETAKRRARV